MNIKMEELEKRFETAKQVEKQAVINAHNGDEYWYLLEYETAETKVAVKLTGLTWKQVENAYDYEACTGVFEMGYIPAKYYEGLKFGSWVTTEFVQYLERGYYEIDESSPEYQDYLKKKMEMTIQLITELFPDEMAAVGMGENNDNGR